MGETTRLTFRRLTIYDADAAALHDLLCFGEHDAWSREAFFYAAKSFRNEFLVAELDGKIIACAGAVIHSDTAEIQTLSVDPNFHGRGIGKIMLTKLIEAVKNRGATFVILEVRPSNTTAIKLYDSFGFQIVDRIKNFYDDEDAWIMAREF